MPQETKSHPGLAAESLPGLSVDLTDSDAAMAILERAFDYRGDVTLDLADGNSVSGYLYDRMRGDVLENSFVRLLPVSSLNARNSVAVRYSDIRKVTFSDRDPAAGKSFETWVKKYVEKKLAGEKASIESEVLD